LEGRWHPAQVPHSHAHVPLDDTAPADRTLVSILGGVVALIAVAAALGMVLLWPSHVPHGANPYSGPNVSRVEATVVAVKAFDCNSRGVGEDNTPMVEGDCAKVTARLTSGGLAKFTLDPTRFVGGGMRDGDEVKLIRIEPEDQPVTYEFYDFQRGLPLTLLAVAFAVVVAAVGRLRGVFALVGIGVTLFALTKFVLPALLAGEPAIPVAVVGSTAIMLCVLYLAHGVSVRTTSALFGTLFGIAFTAATGLAATGWSHLTGIGDENDHLLVATAPALSLSGVVAASMIIAGLGVLNDVTVTQASAVWEMRALKPAARGWEIFASAMRIGRDHIASSVYTLVFAYAGSAMTIMLLITAYQRGWADIATTEQIAQEVVRTLVGAVGLVLAVPVTTGIAVGLSRRPQSRP
jgi:uncharacterized membrane protein